MEKLNKIEKIGNNLIIINDRVYSYTSHIGTINNDMFFLKEEFIKFSKTTTKRINIILAKYNLVKVVM